LPPWASRHEATQISRTGSNLRDITVPRSPAQYAGIGGAETLARRPPDIACGRIAAAALAWSEFPVSENIEQLLIS
ncbi:hypothetical protein, partial [Paraburkholderia atlantica]|uniref:hypothetical protein n=1 Tax=Paraburkholderia atlantica TaxID=2654982 RepID=UPI001D108819